MAALAVDAVLVAMLAFSLDGAESAAVALSDVDRDVISSLLTVTGLVIAIGYWVTTTAIGVTVGKKVFKLRIVAEDGGTPEVKRGVTRYLVSILSCIVIWGYVRMIWSENKQTWHDLAAGTFVVRA